MRDQVRRYMTWREAEYDLDEVRARGEWSPYPWHTTNRREDLLAVATEVLGESA